MPGRQAPEGLLKDPSVRLRRRRSGPGRLHAPELRAGMQVSLPSQLGATATPKPRTLGRGQTVTSPPSRRGMQIRAPGSSWDLPAELGDGQFLRRRSGPPPLAPGRGASGPDAPQPPARGRRGGRATPGPSPHPEPRAPRPAPSRPPLGPPATVECRRRRRRARDSHPELVSRGREPGGGGPGRAAPQVSLGPGRRGGARAAGGGGRTAGPSGAAPRAGCCPRAGRSLRGGEAPVHAARARRRSRGDSSLARSGVPSGPRVPEVSDAARPGRPTRPAAAALPGGPAGA